MAYKYLNGSQVYIYPSANSDDGGDVNNESNLKTLFGSIVDNFVIRDSNGFELTFQGNQGQFYIDSGEAIIDGHYIKTEATSLMVSSVFLSSTGYDISEGLTPHFVIALLKDTTGNARGDLLESVSGNYVRVAKGVGFTLTNTPEQIPDSIDLGVVTINSNRYITKYEVNENSYKYINVSSINDYFVCETSPDDSNKVVKGLPPIIEGTKVHVQFTEENNIDGTVSPGYDLTLNGIPIYVGCRRTLTGGTWDSSNFVINGGTFYNGRPCPWWAIHLPGSVYEFVYSETTICTESAVSPFTVTYIPCWILVNPSSPELFMTYKKSDANRFLQTYWTVEDNIVRGIFYCDWVDDGTYVPMTTLALTEAQRNTYIGSPYPLPVWKKDLRPDGGDNNAEQISFTGISDNNSNGTTWKATLTTETIDDTEVVVIKLSYTGDGPTTRYPAIVPFTYII